VVHLHEGLLLLEEHVGHLGSNGASIAWEFGKEPSYQRTAKLYSGVITVRTRLVVGYIATAPAVMEGSDRKLIRPS
jgi:hypothetical protein